MLRAYSPIIEVVDRARSVITYDTTVIAVLQQAEQSEKLSAEEIILLKSTLAEALLLRDDREAFRKSKEAIKYAEAQNLSKHANLGSAYLAQAAYYYRRFDFLKAIETGESGLTLLNLEMHPFDKLTYIVGSSYAKEGLDSNKVNTLWQQLEQKYARNNAPSTQFYARALEGMFHNYHSQISELLLGVTLKLQNIDHRDKRVLTEGIINHIGGLNNLGQYDDVLINISKLEALFESTNSDDIDKVVYYLTLKDIYSSNPLEGDREEKLYLDKAVKMKPLIAKEAPHVAGLIAWMEGYVEYWKDRKKAKKMWQEALIKYKDVNNTIHDWIYYCSHHTGEFDFALEGYQKMLKREYPSFEPEDVYDNPDISISDAEVYSSMIHILRWKCRTLYKKALVTANEEEAIFLLKKSIQTGKKSMAVLDAHFEYWYPYRYSRYLHQPWQDYTNRFLIFATYELYQRSGDADYLHEMFDYIALSKGLTSDRIFSEMSIPKDVYDELHNEMYELQNIERDWQLSFEGEDKTKTGLRMYDKVVELKSYLQEVRETHPGIEFKYKEIENVSATDVQASLSEGEAYIEYKVGGHDAFAYLITRDTQRAIKYTVEGSYQDKDMQRLARLLQNPMQLQLSKRQKIVQYAHKMYNYLIKPFEAELAGNTKLIIAADGDLHYVPFDVLLASGEVKPYHELDFLLKRFSISYYSSAVNYLKSRERESIQDNSILGFAPVFENSYPLKVNDRSISIFDFQKKIMDGIDNNSFSPLPNTAVEVEAATSSLAAADATIMMKEAATKKTLATALTARPYQFVHIATHGFVNYINPTLSALACYNNDGKAGEHFLYSSEIENMKIEADLVILSSCESGIGRILEGESLLALNRSFIIAGAKNIMYSLWKVNDEQTKNLMVDFYKNYEGGANYAQALRQAKLKMLADPSTASPRYWASFLLMGE